MDRHGFFDPGVADFGATVLFPDFNQPLDRSPMNQMDHERMQGMHQHPCLFVFIRG